LHHLVGLKKLRRLNLGHNPLRPDCLAVLTALPGLTHLSVDCSFPVDDGILDVLGKLKNLEELRLPDKTAAVTDCGLEHLSRLKKLKNLKLRQAEKVTDRGLALLARLVNLQDVSLQELRSVTPRGMQVLGKLTALRRLEISTVAMDNESVRALGQLKKLEDLLLWNVKSGPIDLDALGELTSLRDFRTNQVVSRSAIRALAKLNNLRTITEELTEITDEDLKCLAGLPKLQMLVLGSDQVTAASLPTLAKMTALRYLYVTDKLKVSPEQWTLLGQSSLTRCEISRYRPPYTVYFKPAVQERLSQ
jgi:hypothetical protein